MPQHIPGHRCAFAALFTPSLRFRSAFTSAGVCRTAVTGRRHDIGGSSWPHCPDPAPVQPPGTLPPPYSRPAPETRRRYTSRQAGRLTSIRPASGRTAYVNTPYLRPDSLRQYAAWHAALRPPSPDFLSTVCRSLNAQRGIFFAIEGKRGIHSGHENFHTPRGYNRGFQPPHAPAHRDACLHPTARRRAGDDGHWKDSQFSRFCISCSRAVFWSWCRLQRLCRFAGSTNFDQSPR